MSRLQNTWTSEAAPLARPRPVWSRPVPSALDESTLVEAASDFHALALRRRHPNATTHEDLRQRILVLSCDVESFAELDPSRLDLVVEPTGRNGWRSQVKLECDDSQRASVEIISAPQIAPAAQAPTCPPLPTVETVELAPREAMRAAALHRLGAVDRDLCAKQSMEPDRLLTLEADQHCSRGCLCPSGFVEVFRSTERLHQAGLRRPSRQRLRRVHVFEDACPGDVISVTTHLLCGMPQVDTSLSLRSCARRLSDGSIIAFCETVLR